MVGETVGSYRIVAHLGRGGMGEVFLAEHALIGRRAAVKVLRPSLSANPELVARFFNEARAAARLRHPGLVDVFDFGHHASGSAFLVMELLEGEKLSERLRRGPLPYDLLVAVARQIAAAIGVAHANGIVHRDLKPDNLFLVRDDDLPFGVRVKVVDFGIAKLAGEAAAGVETGPSVLLGTPVYMSPEQCRGAGGVDQRADVYALGCILFQMVTGRPPFVAAAVGDLIAAHLTSTAPRASALAATVEPALEALIARCLAKAPAERPQDMSEVIAALDALPGAARPSTRREPIAPTATPTAAEMALSPTLGASAGAPPPSPSPTAAEVALSTTLGASAGESLPLPPPRRRWWRAPLALVAASALAGGAVVTLKRLRPPATAATAAPSAPAAAPAPRSPTSAAAPAPSPPTAGGPAAPVSVALTVETVPSEAAIYRVSDGVRLGETPRRLELPRSTGALDLLLRRDGYQDQRLSLPLDRDGARRVELAPLRKRAAAPHRRPDERIVDPYAR